VPQLFDLDAGRFSAREFIARQRVTQASTPKQAGMNLKRIDEEIEAAHLRLTYSKYRRPKDSILLSYRRSKTEQPVSFFTAITQECCMFIYD
jgi:hypothetical protein